MGGLIGKRFSILSWNRNITNKKNMKSKKKLQELIKSDK